MKLYSSNNVILILCMIVQTISENVNNISWLQLENCVKNISPLMLKMFCSGKVPSMMWKCELNQLSLKQTKKSPIIASKNIKNLIPTKSYKDAKPNGIDIKSTNESIDNYNPHYLKDGDSQYDTITLVGGAFGCIGLALAIIGIFYYKHYKETF
ncbi:hypothetical protein BMR1_01G00995 [Babesia microti strain RI]|uniref:Uncharacterized protein n=1 Tax=Babesia microti (strain RI) TaxID=1133968 RepID=I7J593_BABMR|nr:hypothetical protein BMR1_01G00995 [Babesia microti strain RI]CCF72662.1 hypothetical protein BMR1_01G00995 [Babesia microti strain RI]|eukprot:XP_012647271.1 hypothetical protein BMR1_01G00995 [Babesia microti strain RI]